MYLGEILLILVLENSFSSREPGDGESLFVEFRVASWNRGDNGHICTGTSSGDAEATCEGPSPKCLCLSLLWTYRALLAAAARCCIIRSSKSESSEWEESWRNQFCCLINGWSSLKQRLSIRRSNNVSDLLKLLTWSISKFSWKRREVDAAEDKLLDFKSLSLAMAARSSWL